jgi:alpha-galactosidase
LAQRVTRRGVRPSVGSDMTTRIRKTRQAVVAAASALLLLATGLANGSVQAMVPAATTYPDLAPTPPMGWNNWSYYGCDVDENVILGNARALVSTGLAAKGYNTVTTDDCWMAKQRDENENLVPDPVKFPHGMAYIGEQLHARGLKFGIYEDAGTLTCARFPGSLNHFQTDADLFARWKADYVKMDGCNLPVPAGQTKEQAYRAAYSQMSQAMLKTGRPMVYLVSAPAYFRHDGDAVWHRVIGWSAEVGNLWRGGSDIALEQYSGASKWSSIKYNYGYNVQLANLQRKGRWNDPDFLLAGDSGLGQDEIQSQMLLWATMAAPLISSTDLTKISPAALAVLGNTDVIAVDQDQLGLQGKIVRQHTGSDVLSKPLANGDRAVALFNSSDEARTISTTAAEAGLPVASSYLLKDLVGKQVRHSTGVISANVRPHATVLLRVHPRGTKAT